METITTGQAAFRQASLMPTSSKELIAEIMEVHHKLSEFPDIFEGLNKTKENAEHLVKIRDNELSEYKQLYKNLQATKIALEKRLDVQAVEIVNLQQKLKKSELSLLSLETKHQRLLQSNRDLTSKHHKLREFVKYNLLALQDIPAVMSVEFKERFRRLENGRQNLQKTSRENVKLISVIMKLLNIPPRKAILAKMCCKLCRQTFPTWKKLLVHRQTVHSVQQSRKFLQRRKDAPDSKKQTSAKRMVNATKTSAGSGCESNKVPVEITLPSPANECLENQGRFGENSTIYSRESLEINETQATEFRAQDKIQHQTSTDHVTQTLSLTRHNAKKGPETGFPKHQLENKQFDRPVNKRKTARSVVAEKETTSTSQISSPIGVSTEFSMHKRSTALYSKHKLEDTNKIGEDMLEAFLATRSSPDSFPKSDGPSVGINAGTQGKRKGKSHRNVAKSSENPGKKRKLDGHKNLLRKVSLNKKSEQVTNALPKASNPSGKDIKGSSANKKTCTPGVTTRPPNNGLQPTTEVNMDIVRAIVAALRPHNPVTSTKD